MTNDQASTPKNQLGWLRQKDEDAEQIKRLEETILKNAGGLARFKKDISVLLRQSIDEVIDTPRTNRCTLAETKISERIYLSTKVRVRLRSFLKLPRGRILNHIDSGTEMCIQSTIRQNWEIPSTIVGHPCVLIRSDVKRSVCSVGAIVVRDEVLCASRNPSGRRMISRAGLASIRWILKDEPLPFNS
jgi:hypothetical protein